MGEEGETAGKGSGQAEKETLGRKEQGCAGAQEASFPGVNSGGAQTSPGPRGLD